VNYIFLLPSAGWPQQLLFEFSLMQPLKITLMDFHPNIFRFHSNKDNIAVFVAVKCFFKITEMNLQHVNFILQYSACVLKTEVGLYYAVKTAMAALEQLCSNVYSFKAISLP